MFDSEALETPTERLQRGDRANQPSSTLVIPHHWHNVIRLPLVVPVSRFFENGTQAHELGARATGLRYRLTHRCGRRPEGPELLAPI